MWNENKPVGEGVQWSEDQKKAARLKNGIPVGSVSLEEAGKIAARLGMPPPSSWWVKPAS